MNVCCNVFIISLLSFLSATLGINIELSYLCSEKCIISYMTTLKDLFELAGTRKCNEFQKSFIRNNFAPCIAAKMCGAIDRKEKTELLNRCMEELTEYERMRQKAIWRLLILNYR